MDSAEIDTVISNSICKHEVGERLGMAFKHASPPHTITMTQ